jgi:alginate O-acetyltransferase complex protein AlgI
MLFQTPEYFAFFAIVWLTYWHLPHRGQNVLLLLASFVFYGWWDWRFLLLLIATASIDFCVALGIDRARQRGANRTATRILFVSIGANLVVLGVFKYFNFFIDSAEQALHALGFQGSFWTLHIILPVGVSFYTFQAMSYTIDVYRGVMRPVRSLSDFVLYVCFFPQLVAGPIERASSLLPQVQRPRMLWRRDIEEGLLLFALGFFRKVAIADPAGAIADHYFGKPDAFSSVQLVVGLLLYGVQIYNDFAGYSDMARGSARLLGFTLMRNFRHPYFAKNISDFWTRWHISLSTWLRDYLYIPLGGNRRGPARTRWNLIVTMLLGGLWHGAAWTFVVWGALHAAYLIAHHAWVEWRAPRQTEQPQASDDIGIGWAAARCAQSIGVVALVTFAWLFFRAPDFATAWAYLGGILSLTPGAEGAVIPLAVLAGLMLSIDLPQAAADDEYVFLKWPVAPRALAGATAVLVLLASGSTHAPFIYFQF